MQRRLPEDPSADRPFATEEDGLLPAVYGELRQLAAACLRRAPGHVVLQPTALVHEAYLKIRGAHDLDDRDRTHFCALAARAMRQVLVDEYRGEHRAKRADGRRRITLSGIEADVDSHSVEADELEGALRDLEELDERAARVVTLRFFGGLQVDEIAELLAVTDRTVRNDWRMARAWLRRRLGGADSGSEH